MRNNYNRIKRTNKPSVLQITCLDWRVDKLETIAIRNEPVTILPLLVRAILGLRGGRARIQPEALSTSPAN